MPSNSNKASSDAGPELAGRDGIAAMESPEALMCPLEKGVRGIEISKSSRRQPCCCCPVTVQKEQQGIIRCRAGVGGQGKPCGDGKPVGPDVPP